MSSKRRGLGRFKMLNGIIDRFKEARILVIGDIMLDRFVWGQVSRISPEAPVPVVNVTRESFRPGGAGNVVSNIVSLGGKVFLSGVVGTDLGGQKMVKEIESMGINVGGVIFDKMRPTTMKTRIIAHQQQVVRFDKEVRHEISDDTFKSIRKFLDAIHRNVDAVIVSDYGKGVINRKLINELLKLAQKRKIPISIDPKVNSHIIYKGVTCITPNNHEAGRMFNREIIDDKSLMAVGKGLMKRLGTKYILVTRGEKGMTLFQKSGRVIHIPTSAKEIYDVTGAGDTVISVLTLALAVGAPILDAAYLSNYAAGIVVGKVGTATINIDELREVLRKGNRE